MSREKVGMVINQFRYGALCVLMGAPKDEAIKWAMREYNIQLTYDDLSAAKKRIRSKKQHKKYTKTMSKNSYIMRI